ncbi:MAG TPA: hypothetical protein VFE47_05575 [Tepidisphaeraceae bacterium]|nr:hypothetical protein [Tepidisphaeraceae bacterium]
MTLAIWNRNIRPILRLLVFLATNFPRQDRQAAKSAKGKKKFNPVLALLATWRSWRVHFFVVADGDTLGSTSCQDVLENCSLNISTKSLPFQPVTPAAAGNKNF